jgi:hypothetical protein
MARWSQLETEAPEIARAGRYLLAEHVLAYFGTTRADGSPRVHPVVPMLADGDLFVAIGDWSPKWRDLRRDPRCVLHALPGSRDDEFVLRCRAQEDRGSLESVRDAANHVIHDDDHVVRLDIDQADHGWWEHVGQPDTYPVRSRWTPGTGTTTLKAGRRKGGHLDEVDRG